MIFWEYLADAKFALSERTKCETSHIKNEQVNRGVIFCEKNLIKTNYCIYRAAYTVTALKKSGWYDDTTYLNEKTQLFPKFHYLKESVCLKLWHRHKVVSARLGDFEFIAPKIILNDIVGGGSD